MPVLGGGLTLGGGSSGGAPALTLSLSASSSQGDLVTVSEDSTVAGGTGSYFYAWTLTDPTGTSRTALLSSSTAADPTWTPDAIPGAWLLTCTVTSGSQTATAARVLTLGTSGYVEIVDFDFTQEADQSPSGNALTVANRAQQGNPSETLALVNEAADVASGPKIASGKLVISPVAGTSEFFASASAQAAPGFSLALAGVLTGFGQSLKRGMTLLVVAAFDSAIWVNTNDKHALTLEATTGLGGGAGSSGLSQGFQKQAGGVRLNPMAQTGTTRTGNPLTSTDATGARCLAMLVLGGSKAQSGWSTDVTDADTLADALALAQSGSPTQNIALPYSTAADEAVEYMLPAQWRVGVYAGTPGASNGAVLNLTRLRVFLGGVV